jgi:hypothetical protein
MIPFSDCISILDQREESAAYARFKGLASAAEKLKKEGGYQATQSFKKDGVYVHFEYVDRAWLIRAVHLYSKKESGFSSYLGEFKSGVTIQHGRQALVAALGAPSSSGGDGTVGRFGIVNRVWERWDYEGYSLRFDYEADGSTIYTGCIQRPRDVQEFEKKRRANQTAQTTPGSSAPLRV